MIKSRKSIHRLLEKSLVFVLILFFSILCFSIRAYAADDYPWKDRSGTDPYGMIYKQCTSFCAYRLNANGIPFNDTYKGGSWGHATTWGSVAQSVGISVDMNPQVGDIGWKVAGKGGAGDYGHVVYISAVNGDTVTCEQYNWDKKKEAYIVTTENKSRFSGFIHFGTTHTCSFADWNTVPTKKPTETEDGIMTFYCTDSSCNKTMTRTIPKLKMDTVKEGTYLIHSALDTNTCVSIMPGQHNKQGYTALYSRDSELVNHGDQEFHFSRNSDGSYIISWGDWVLDAKNGYMTERVWLYDRNGSGAQNWFINKFDDGRVQLINQHLCGCLDLDSGKLDDGSKIQTWVNYGYDNQYFTLELVKCDVHDWDNGVVTKKPTATEYGIRTYTCRDCHMTKEKKDGKPTGGWSKEGGKWYYYGTNGQKVTGWKQISKKWYYFDASGVMQTGWQKISKKWYYFNASGAMQTGWQKISKKWYYFDASGAMLSGWQKIDGKWYFLKSGVMVTGWQQIGGKWYFFSNGAMVTGTKTIGGKTYKFDANGVCLNP